VAKEKAEGRLPSTTLEKEFPEVAELLKSAEKLRCFACGKEWLGRSYAVTHAMWTRWRGYCSLACFCKKAGEYLMIQPADGSEEKEKKQKKRRIRA